MTHIYRPILRWKRGERVALSHLGANARLDVVPLFILRTDQFKGRPETQARQSIAAPAVIAEEIERIWGDNPFSIDASALKPGPQGQHPLAEIAQECNQRGLNLLPATTLNADAAYQSECQTVAQADGRGVVLRVDLDQFTSAANWIQQWPHALNATDLVVDVGSDVATVANLGAAVTQAFTQLHLGTSWRTVAIAGTSMPENFSGYQAGVHWIDRREATLWQSLTQSRLPYRLDFGDYATVPLTPPPSGIAWGFPINVRYTTSHHFMICRGVNTTGINAQEMDVQLKDHANQIFSHPSRDRLNGVWADDRIDAIAQGQSAPGNLESWVQIAVNRHIERTRADLP